MEFKNFLKSWQGANSENKFHRWLIGIQSVALVVALVGWQSKDRVTVIVPPTLNEKAEISQRAASVGYKKSWGLYVAELLGNITPSNVEFVVESLSSMMTGDTYEKFRTTAALQVEKIKRDGMSVSFEPRSVQYERITDKVFVTGNSVVDAAGVKAPQTFTRVFEVMIDINNGVPTISYIDTYQGQPKTREVLERLEKEDESAKKINEAQEVKKREQDRNERRSKRDTTE
jgi:conjugal transfer pilus assembly protein TraE